MKNLAFIPARGGSKRLPNKNRLLLNGVPLVVYTIRAAKKSRMFQSIVVSTDDQYVAELAEKEKVSVDQRKKELAGDRVTVVEVLKEYLARAKRGKPFDTVAALYPTSPFRDEMDIKNAYHIFFNSSPSAPSLVSIAPYDFPPQFCMGYDDTTRSVEMDCPENFLSTQSQSHERKYHPNGAIFISYIDHFLKTGTFYGPSMKGYVMDKEHSIDIDDGFQFKLAQFILTSKSTVEPK